MLSEFEAENAKALAKLRADKKIKIRSFPPEVLADLRKLAAETIKEVTAGDPLAAKVNREFQAFRQQLSGWSSISEKEYYDHIIG
jgi:TRAP-type mannitol/chloroaromatic compound transport system substrate-binding protein